MAKDYKYEDSTPVDEPVRKGSKVQEPGSGIKVEPENKFSEYEKRLKDVESKREKPSKSEMLLKAAGAMMSNMPKPESKAKGGMTASSRADGCCVKGKTKGRMY
jgi:hypothetical protein